MQWPNENNSSWSETYRMAEVGRLSEQQQDPLEALDHERLLDRKSVV